MSWSISVTPYSYPKYTRKGTKAHHDAMNRRTRLKRLTVIQNTCSKSKVVHRPHCLKRVLRARGSNPRFCYVAEFPSPWWPL